jgi:hypothetical protein
VCVRVLQSNSHFRDDLETSSSFSDVAAGEDRFFPPYFFLPFFDSTVCSVFDVRRADVVIAMINMMIRATQRGAWNTSSSEPW